MYEIKKLPTGPFRYYITRDGYAVTMATTYWGARFVVWRDRRQRRRRPPEHVVWSGK